MLQVTRVVNAASFENLLVLVNKLLTCYKAVIFFCHKTLILEKVTQLPYFSLSIIVNLQTMVFMIATFSVPQTHYYPIKVAVTLLPLDSAFLSRL